MYGLPQAGSLGHDLLELRLNKEGYYQSKIVPGLWQHENRPITFTVVVDDFGIKYMTEQDLDHLIKTLHQYCDISLDLSGKEYVKIELDWDYKNKCVHLSMAPYLKKALTQFGVKKPKRLQTSLYAYIPPNYGTKQQFVQQDLAPPATKAEQTHVQQVTGKFLWYACAFDGTMLTPLSSITAQQAMAMSDTINRVKQFLDYAASQEPAVLT